jgi:hypothetical protein
VTKLGYEIPEKVIKNLNEGEKIQKVAFVFVTLIIQDQNKNVIRIYVSLFLKFLESVTKFWGINHQFVTKLNYQISVILDHH